MTTNDISLKRKSRFNPDRQTYLSSDGKYYCYVRWNDKKNCYETLQFEVGKDVSMDVTIQLDDMDHEEDLSNRYENELQDPHFAAKIDHYKDNQDDEDAMDPWNMVPDNGNNPEETFFSEPEPENPQIKEVRRVIDEECTEAQQDLFFNHFGMDIQLETLRQNEGKRTGVTPSPQALTNRKNKLIEKAAKSLGVERVKRCNQVKKETD